jgi:hypothetical protein
MKSRIFFVAAWTFFLTTSITFGYEATFEPRISVGTEYTDNLFLEDSSEENEWITTISPSFKADIRGKKTGAIISYDPSYAFYDDFDEFDHWRHRARLNGWAELSKNTRITVNDYFLYTEDPLSIADIAPVRVEDPDEPIDDTLRKTRKTYYRNTARVNLSHQFGEFDSFNIGYKHYFLENDSSIYEDKQTHNPYMDLTYWFTYRWGVNIGASYTKGDRDDSDDYDFILGNARLLRRFSKRLNGFVQLGYGNLDYDGNSEDAEGYDLSAGFDYTISKDTFMSVAAGYAWLDRDKSSNESAPSVGVTIKKTLKKGVIYLTGSGGYKEPTSGAESLGVREYYEAGTSVRYELTKYLSGNVFASYRYDDYLESTPDREDKTTKAGLGLNFQVLKWMSLGLNYRFRTVDSDRDLEEYDENRVFFEISLFPPQPFRTSHY